MVTIAKDRPFSYKKIRNPSIIIQSIDQNMAKLNTCWWILSLLLLATSVLCQSRDRKEVINIVFALPENPSKYPRGLNDWQLSLSQAKPVLEIAQRDIDTRRILPNHKLNITHVDTQSSDIHGTFAVIEYYKKGQMDCIIGFANSYPMAPIARISWLWNKGIPLITTANMATAMDDRNQYKLMTRLNGSYKTLAEFFIKIMRKFKWTNPFFLVHTPERKKELGQSECMFQSDSLIDALTREFGIAAIGENFDSFDDNRHQKILHGLKFGSKASNVIVVCSPDQSAIREIVMQAFDLKMHQGRYIFLNLDISTGSFERRPWFRKEDDYQNNSKAKEAYKAVKTISLLKSSSEEYEEFEKDVAKKARKEKSKEYKMNSFISAFYDSLILYAQGLNRTIADRKDFRNGTEVTNRMWNQTFDGMAGGSITIDETGDRLADYSILGYDMTADAFQDLAHYYAPTETFKAKKAVDDWFWAGEESKPPAQKPICGFDMSLCPEAQIPTWKWLLIAFAIIMLIFIIGSVLFYRHMKLESELAAMYWRINWEELMGEERKKEKPKNVKVDKWGQTVTVNEDVTNPLITRRDSFGNKSLLSVETIALNGHQQIFIKTAKYKGTIVAIKKLNIRKAKIELNRSLLFELKKMRDLQHDHIVKFIGACIDAPNFCIVTEYGSKGSLQDLLENESIDMDKMMIYSLIHDLVKAMDFIHHCSDIKSHGNLKSSNCVVDSRFVLKVTDFGLHSLRRLQEIPEEENESSYVFWKKLLWTPPELLRMKNPPEVGTPKGDVYAFGIILHEMAFRQGPFFINFQNSDPKDTLERIKKGEDLRPCTDIETCCDPQVIELMVHCWSEHPIDRPDFTYIKKRIRALNRKFETGNIVDNLLKRMEQYATNLEGVVEERTADLKEEKNKVKDLLHQLLPQSVADTLIRGEAVRSESYDDVTIYFSDIVGFTALSSLSTPMEVVALLNDLYTAFDSVIEHYDVYKVETIGDAYMVVSGLPEKNGDLHASEIAKMSLALLDRVRTFVIRHRPQDQLKLRIGIHTGGVCAGVVGIKMPRYCLFGDTVNTASRMESNGLPLKIHVSTTTKDFLDKFPGFELEYRGEIEMKGKGMQKTYWLNNYSDPSPPPAALPSLSQPNYPAILSNYVSNHSTPPPHGLRGGRKNVLHHSSSSNVAVNAGNTHNSNSSKAAAANNVNHHGSLSANNSASLTNSTIGV